MVLPVFFSLTLMLAGLSNAVDPQQLEDPNASSFRSGPATHHVTRLTGIRISSDYSVTQSEFTLAVPVDPDDRSRPYVPTQTDEAIRTLLDGLDDRGQQYFREIGDADEIVDPLGGGISAWLRSYWFRQGSPLRLQLEDRGIAGPDDQVSILVLAVWHKLHGRDGMVDQLIEQTRAFEKARIVPDAAPCPDGTPGTLRYLMTFYQIQRRPFQALHTFECDVSGALWVNEGDSIWRDPEDLELEFFCAFFGKEKGRPECDH